MTSWRVRLVWLALLTAYLVWKAFEFGWESAVFWAILLVISLGLLVPFLRLLARQEGKTHSVRRRSALWGIFLAVFVGIPAFVWIVLVSDPVGFLLLVGFSAVFSLILYALGRLKGSQRRPLTSSRK